MRTYHTLDTNRVYAGVSKTIEIYETWPVNSTFIELPEIPEGKFAQLNGNEWAILEAYPPPPIEPLRTERREYLKTERDNVIDADINNVQVGRITDRENIQGTLANWDLLGLGESIKWVMADNTTQLLSKADLQAVFMGYATRKFQCFDAYDQSLTALYNATTAEEIMAVTFNFGE